MNFIYTPLGIVFPIKQPGDFGIYVATSRVCREQYVGQTINSFSKLVWPVAIDTLENNLESILSDPINPNLMMNQQRFLNDFKKYHQHLTTKSRNSKLLFSTIRSKN